MHETAKFLTENPNGFLATNDGCGARVRPFQFMMEKEGKLYFCTANTKSVYKQLKANPMFEYSSMSQKFEWIRVSGEAVFEDNRAVKTEILDKTPLVKSIYQSPDNPVFEVFYIKNGKAVIADFSGNPPRNFEI